MALDNLPVVIAKFIALPTLAIFEQNGNFRPVDLHVALPILLQALLVCVLVLSQTVQITLGFVACSFYRNKLESVLEFCFFFIWFTKQVGKENQVILVFVRSFCGMERENIAAQNAADAQQSENWAGCGGDPAG